jgi:hypothetical protein
MKILTFILAALIHGNFCTSYRKISPVRLVAFTNFSSVQAAREVDEDKSSLDAQVGHLEHSFPTEKTAYGWAFFSQHSNYFRSQNKEQTFIINKFARIVEEL